jgi:hypothetical protein
LLYVEPDGTRIGVEVKYVSPLLFGNQVLNLVGAVTVRRREEPLEKFIIVLVNKDEDEAKTTAIRCQRMISIPSSVLLVIGYLNASRE